MTRSLAHYLILVRNRSSLVMCPIGSDESPASRIVRCSTRAPSSEKSHESHSFQKLHPQTSAHRSAARLRRAHWPPMQCGVAYSRFGTLQDARGQQVKPGLDSRGQIRQIGATIHVDFLRVRSIDRKRVPHMPHRAMGSGDIPTSPTLFPRATIVGRKNARPSSRSAPVQTGPQ